MEKRTPAGNILCSENRSFVQLIDSAPRASLSSEACGFGKIPFRGASHCAFLPGKAELLLGRASQQAASSNPAKTRPVWDNPDLALPAWLCDHRRSPALSLATCQAEGSGSRTVAKAGRCAGRLSRSYQPSVAGSPCHFPLYRQGHEALRSLNMGELDYPGNQCVPSPCSADT